MQGTIETTEGMVYIPRVFRAMFSEEDFGRPEVLAMIEAQAAAKYAGLPGIEEAEVEARRAAAVRAAVKVGSRIIEGSGRIARAGIVTKVGTRNSEIMIEARFGFGRSINHCYLSPGEYRIVK